MINPLVHAIASCCQIMNYVISTRLTQILPKTILAPPGITRKSSKRSEEERMVSFADCLCSLDCRCASLSRCGTVNFQLYAPKINRTSFSFRWHINLVLIRDVQNASFIGIQRVANAQVMDVREGTPGNQISPNEHQFMV